MGDIIVLHIGCADGDKTAGVSVSIPEYLRFQSLKCQCALLNLANVSYIDFNCFLYEEYKSIDCLPGIFKNPSIVIFHELYRLPFLRLYKECIKKNIPYVIIPHGGLTKKAQSVKRIKKIIGNILFFNQYIKKSSYIHFLSKKEKENSIWNGHNNFVLGNGIDLLDIRQEEIEKENDEFEMLFIGRYDIYFKGLDVLLEAISTIKSFMIDHGIVLNLYGKGTDSDENFIRTFIKENDLIKIVKFHGPVFDDEKIRKYCAADIFIQTSRSEGQPMGILEAMSCCLPVLVTPGTAMAFTVERYDLGYSVELNADLIGKKIVEAYENRKNLKKKGSNARQYIVENFDGKNIAKRAIEIYEEIVKRNI